ncbi:MAG: hypothetical protein GY859_23805, partial [Desulfobacterales bacterium]|nr:hypothetical protein [Desulfobacterales bacterium]
MTPYVSVYSPNAIRGEIIVKSLMTEGVETRLHTDPFQAEEALKETSSPVIVLDVAKNFASEAGLLRSVAFHLPERTFIIIAHPANIKTLENLELPRAFIIPGHVDPRRILSIVKESLQERENTPESKTTPRENGEEADHAPPRGPRKGPGDSERIGPWSGPWNGPGDGPGDDTIDGPGNGAGKEGRNGAGDGRDDGPTWRRGTTSPRETAPDPGPVRLITRIGGILKLFAFSLLLAALLSAAAMGGYLYWCISTLPDVDSLKDYAPFKTSKIYSYDNKPLAEFFVEKRTSVSIAKIPPHVINAFIAIEDAHYYTHEGVDVVRILGALVANVKEWEYLQGASTITQQLAKMVFLKPEKTLTRKIQQIALSLQIEEKYSKNEILELYFNKAYFGAGAYGIEVAARTYFNKSVADVGLSEAALLAGLPKAPSVYSPLKNPAKAMKRRNLVLKRMLETGYITEGMYQKTLLAPVPGKFHGPRTKAPYFVDFCRRSIEKEYGRRLYTSGLIIYTSLDLRMQEIVESAVENGVKRLKKRGVHAPQAAVVVMDVKTGWIRAMVGGVNFWESQFNRATQAKRQPGSAFKPFVYLAALDQGLTMETEID